MSREYSESLLESESLPESELFSFDLGEEVWGSHGPLPPSMDHRSLLYAHGWFYLAGGMVGDQEVSKRVLRFRLTEPE